MFLLFLFYFYACNWRKLRNFQNLLIKDNAINDFRFPPSQTAQREEENGKQGRILILCSRRPKFKRSINNYSNLFHKIVIVLKAITILKNWEDYIIKFIKTTIKNLNNYHNFFKKIIKATLKNLNNYHKFFKS